MQGVEVLLLHCSSNVCRGSLFYRPKNSHHIFRKKSTRRERYVLILNMKTKLRKDVKYTVQTHLVFPMMPLPQLTRLYLHKMSDISCCRKWVGRLVSPWENQKQELLSRYVICPFHYITKSKMW